MLPRVAVLLVVAVLAGGCRSGNARTAPTSTLNRTTSNLTPQTPKPSPTPTLSTSPLSPPSSAPAPAATTNFADWPVFQANPGHSGVAASSGGGGASAPVVAWMSSGLDGDDNGQPIVAGGRVIVATENNSVYAFSAGSGAQLWMHHLGTPQRSDVLPCGNISPVSGITSTPVSDPGAGLVYVLAFLSSGTHELYALHLSDGSVAWSRPADAPGQDPLTSQQRAALILANGFVYIAYGGLYGDCGSYHGAVVGIPASGSGTTISYVVPSQGRAGIWAPGGLTVAPSGDLYVATGNSSSVSAFDYGNAVIRLSPTLQPLSSFAPANWASLNGEDSDLGSTSPTLVDGGHVFQVGKAGTGYLLSATNLGGVGGQLSSTQVCPAAFGGTAYFAPVAYVACSSQLVAVTVGSGSLSIAWRAPGLDAGPPIVAMGWVWVLDVSGGVLDQLNPANGAVMHSVPTPAVGHFAAPTASGGLIIVPGLREVEAFRAG